MSYGENFVFKMCKFDFVLNVTKLHFFQIEVDSVINTIQSSILIFHFY